MEILHLCPAKFATGGTESIHKLVHEFNQIEGVHARILYEGPDCNDPQPEEYRSYSCDYVTELPEGFKGVLIFPEIWGNRVIDPQYKDCVTAINWAGVDVYDWNNSPSQRGLFLRNKNTIHLAQLDYAMDTLTKWGIDSSHLFRISDVLNDEFFRKYAEGYRSNEVLYNPLKVKMTNFQRRVMQRCTTEYGVKFLPLIGYTRHNLAHLMRHSKLYIDFGVFSGRERLPREAAMCGCCVVTSTSGAAGYYRDVSIDGKYKFDWDQIDDAVTMIKNLLDNYSTLRSDFDQYRQSLIEDREMLPKQVRAVCKRFEEAL